MINKSWLAAHLYYTEPWDEFIVTAVKPFVESIFKEKIAEQYFFIRYWERGPHIRLRFYGNTEKLAEQLKPRLENYFHEYYRTKPSKDPVDDWLSQLRLDQQWYPNNSIQYIRYEPEIERYGGGEAIVISEKLFEHSSNAVIAIMSESNDWTYEKALGSAIQLHLSFAYAVSMNLSEVKHFYDYIFRIWFHRAYNNYEQNLSAEEIKIKSQNTLRAFEQSFLAHKDHLIGTHQTLWNAFKNRTEFEQEWMNEWMLGVKQINRSILQLQKVGKLIAPPTYHPGPFAKINENLWERMRIYESYIHMTNNRIGILNRDEAFLGYLIKKSLEKLK